MANNSKNLWHFVLLAFINPISLAASGLLLHRTPVVFPIHPAGDSIPVSA
jgi:hypothetical protein